jgi:hypothetical protein
MAKCTTCGNEYAKTFDVRIDGRTMTFDCIECAAQAIAPTCAHCSCRVLGHGVEQDGTIYCCSSCARMASRDQRPHAARPPI